MHCERSDFFSILESWSDKLCLVLITSDYEEGRFFLQVNAVLQDSTVRLTGAEGTELDLDLSQADAFEFDDSVVAPLNIRDTLEKNFESILGARVTGKFAVRFLLTRSL